MKKIFSLLLASTLMLGFVGCGGNSTPNKVVTEVEKPETPEVTEGSETVKEAVEQIVADGSYPAEKVKIGVEIYNPTDAEFLEMQSYFTYLSEKLNVEFIYSEAIKSAEEEMQFIENCAISGVKAILGYYNISGVEAVAKTLEYDMYYWGSAEQPAVYEAYKDNPLYLGAVTYGEGDYTAGYELGKYVIDQGAKKLVYASGGANFGSDMFVKRRNGFLAAVEEAKVAGRDISVIDVGGFPGDAFFADQASALTQDIDAVCASFNGLDFWAQPIASAGKKDTVKLATIGSIGDTFQTAFADGSISFLASGNIQKFGLAVGMILNAVDGNAEALKEGGIATNLEQGFWLISSEDEVRQILDIQANDKVYSAEEIMTLSQVVNPDASAKTLKDLVASYRLEDLLARKGR